MEKTINEGILRRNGDGLKETRGEFLSGATTARRKRKRGVLAIKENFGGRLNLDNQSNLHMTKTATFRLMSRARRANGQNTRIAGLGS